MARPGVQGTTLELEGLQAFLDRRSALIVQGSIVMEESAIAGQFMDHPMYKNVIYGVPSILRHLHLGTFLAPSGMKQTDETRATRSA